MIEKYRGFLKKHSDLIGVWASLATIAGFFLTLLSYNLNQQLDKYKVNVEVNGKLIEAQNAQIDDYKVTIENLEDSIKIDGNNNIAIKDSIVNQMLMEPNKFSADELLRQAEGSINSKNYQNALLIYNLDVFENSPVALCNLGFLYAKGLGVEKDINKAESLYIKAYEVGCQQALINRFVLYKDNIQRDNDYERFVYVMLNEAILNENNPMHEKAVEKYGNKVFDGEKEDLRHTQCEFKLDVGVEQVPDRPLDTWRIRWYWISNTNIESNGLFGRYQIWGYDERECTFDNLFDDELAKV